MSTQINLVQRVLDIRDVASARSSFERRYVEGIIAIRKLHTNVVTQTGFTCAEEMLYPENHAYLSDLLGYVAIGARSVENQQHRIVASGVGIPAGNEKSYWWRSNSYDEFDCSGSSRSKICLSWLGSTDRWKSIGSCDFKGICG